MQIPTQPSRLSPRPSTSATPHRLTPRWSRRWAVVLLAVLVLLPLAACETDTDDGEGGDERAATDVENGSAGDATSAADDDYADRMAEEHAGDSPLPAFAGDQGRYADVEVATREVAYATVDGTEVTGYLAMPEGAEASDDVALPALIVIHEWWGLNDNVETMARLFAHHGYAALAVDLYNGEAADSPQAARELMSAVDETTAKDNLRQAYEYLQGEVGASRVGLIGWCFGGGWSLQAALAMPEELDAAVIYYGRLVEDRERLEALDMPLLGIFGAEDDGIPVEGVRAFESTLQELGKDAEIHVYDGAGHAFANPSGERYQPEAARQAWEETISFLDEQLKQ